MARTLLRTVVEPVIVPGITPSLASVSPVGSISPALRRCLGSWGPLLRPASVISKDVKDKEFSLEPKQRAKLVIAKVVDAQRTGQAAA